METTRILQTLSEVGLEHGSIGWPEPRLARFIAPRYGSQPMPWKLLISLLLIFAVVGFFFWRATHDFSFVASLTYWLWSSLVVIGAALLLFPLDYMARKNIWLFNDTLVRTHARSREVLRLADVEAVFVYRPRNRNPGYLLEFLSKSGHSMVVGVPEEVGLARLLELLRSLGLQVQSDL